MKTIRFFLLLLLPVLLLASCNGPLQIEKRHYRHGWYVSNGRTHEKSTPVTAAAPEAQAAVTEKNAIATEELVQPAAPGVKTIPAVQLVTSASAVPVKAVKRVMEKIKTKPAPVPAITKDEPAAKDSATTETSIPNTAIASLVLGIVAVTLIALSPVIFASTLSFLVVGFAVGVLICGVFAILMGREALKDTTQGAPGRKMAIAGRVLGFIVVFGLGLGLLAVLVMALLWGY